VAISFEDPKICQLSDVISRVAQYLWCRVLRSASAIAWQSRHNFNS